MFKTPLNERKRSVVDEDGSTETPKGVQGTSAIEPSVLNTPEEPGKVYDKVFKRPCNLYFKNLNNELTVC